MRLDRLRKVTWREIACRGRQRGHQWIDRLAPRFGPGGIAGRVPRGADRESAAAAYERFCRTAPHRLPAGATGRGVASLIDERCPDARRHILAAADQIMAGRFDLLGYTALDFGDPIDWHLDPVAGRRAPRVHWSRIDALDPERVGDSKVTWELNRHQWLVTLAQAYQLTGRARYAEHALDAMDAWIEANPYGIGINWASSLEAALRTIAWCWTLAILRTSTELGPERFARYQRVLLQHARHIEAYLSHYYSPNTHLTGEALGLLYAGVAFADQPDAARWRDLGRRILLEELTRQVTPDGVYFEQATCYHRYTVEIYLHLLVLASRNGLALGPDTRSAVLRMLEWLLAMVQPDRTMPPIGDADGGWLLPLSKRAPADCRGIFSVAGALFEQPELAWAAGGPTPELIWLLGGEGLAQAGRAGIRWPVTMQSRVFATGGYAVMRSGWQPDAHQLIMDVGPLGCPISGAHGHADLLSIQCSAFGEPYLIDPGTFCYTADARWRNHFRSTAAHNTIRIDGQDQAEPRGPFSWVARPTARLQAWEHGTSHDYADGMHDGYARLPEPVRHRRRVLFVKPRGWVIVDDLTGNGPHHIEIRFQFSPRQVSLGPGLWTAAQGRRGQGLWLVPLASQVLSAEIREGQEDPIDGWMSPGYGVRTPAPVVVYHGTVTTPLRITTLVVPVETMAAAPPALEVTHGVGGDIDAFRFPGDDRVIHIAADALTIEAGAECLRIA